MIYRATDETEQVWFIDESDELAKIWLDNPDLPDDVRVPRQYFLPKVESQRDTDAMPDRTQVMDDRHMRAVVQRQIYNKIWEGLHESRAGTISTRR